MTTEFKGSLSLLGAKSLSTSDSELMGTFHSINGGGLDKGANNEALGGEAGSGLTLFLHLLGIQKNAQALHRMLKQPLICRSSKPRLDTFQKPYVPKEKRVSISATDWS